MLQIVSEAGRRRPAPRTPAATTLASARFAKVDAGRTSRKNVQTNDDLEAAVGELRGRNGKRPRRSTDASSRSSASSATPSWGSDPSPRPPRRAPAGPRRWRGRGPTIWGRRALSTWNPTCSWTRRGKANRWKSTRWSAGWRRQPLGPHRPPREVAASPSTRRSSTRGSRSSSRARSPSFARGCAS